MIGGRTSFTIVCRPQGLGHRRRQDGELEVPIPATTAANITVEQTLALLDTSFQALGLNVANGRSVFWLGSGISLGRASGLWGVVAQVLEFLRSNIDSSDPGCPYRRAVGLALALTDLPEGSRAAIDLSQPVADWREHDQIVRALVNRYAALLDVPIPGKPNDFLLWEAADVLGNFSPALEPDAEHLGLAILALEGAAPEVVSANWDGLIEKAVESLADDSSQVLVVCVRGIELRQDVRLMRLLKFHGCAIRAHANPDTYREYLIGRASQITRWPNEQRFRLMRQELVALVAKRPTLMIGLSAQDEDVRQVFSEAQETMHWDWREDERIYVFANDALDPNHREILRLAFDEAYPDHGEQIESTALLRTYAKQAITALVLFVIAAKAEALAERCDSPYLAIGGGSALFDGIMHLRDRAGAAAGNGHLGFLESFVGHYAWAERLFRLGAPLEAASPRRYRPLSQLPLDRIPGDPSLATNGAREASAAIGLLGKGDKDGLWSVGIGPTASGHRGALRVTTKTGERAVYLVANGEAAVRLKMAGVVDDSTSEAIVIYSKGPADALQRSPAAAVGRTNSTGPREISMSSILHESKDGADLIDSFRQASSL
jgi:hypothetical protein